MTDKNTTSTDDGQSTSTVDQGRLPKRDDHLFVIPPHPNTNFNDEEFLDLLEGSISLSMEEKQRVIEAIPRLSIEQVHELINIFKEEQTKFAELESEFSEDVSRLKQEREKEVDIKKIKQEEESEDSEAEAEAEELRKQLLGE